VRPPWLIDRDLNAVAAHLDAWILAAEPHHHPQASAVPLLGTPEWVAADDTTRNASVALYVLACLAEREPVVIAARLAAEIAAGRTAHLIAMRQASHAISAALRNTATNSSATNSRATNSRATNSSATNSRATNSSAINSRARGGTT
jgi:hypothetical protein